MSDHSRALVPLEAWAFNSPDLLTTGIQVDLGHLAEALIYYDQVFLNVSNQPQFARVVAWFVNQGRFETLISLVKEGTLQVYEYSFMTAPIHDPETDQFVLMNIQDQGQLVENSFERRYLYHRDIEGVVLENKNRRKLYDAFRDRVVEVKAEQFSKSIEEARRDFADGERSALIVQSFVDVIYEYRHLGRPPKVDCVVVNNADGSHTTTFSVDFKSLSQLAGPRLNWDKHSPIAGNALSCRLLQSASDLRCDLYLAQPMSRLVGDKLFESARAVNRPRDIIETLQESVEFPDVRHLVNAGRLSIDDVLQLRAKAQRFRRWLQDEASRDRDALIAYHHETAKEAGFVNSGKKALSLFGFVGGAAVGAALGAGAGPLGSAAGAAAGGTLSWLADIGSKMGGEWRPVVFGNWLRTRIEELDKGRHKS